MASILVIDDLPDIRMTIEAFLMPLGHEITEAQDGLEALTQLAKNEFDLIITDILMPKMNGNEVIRLVKTMDNRPAIIAISGGVNTMAKNTTLEEAQQNADFFLKKPFSSDELKDAVNSLLKKDL